MAKVALQRIPVQARIRIMCDETRMSFEWTEYESPTVAVISAVSAVENTPPDELPPLSDSLDPDAINAIIEATDSSDGTVSVTFTYCNYEVVLFQRGELRLGPTADSDGDDEFPINGQAGCH